MLPSEQKVLSRIQIQVNDTTYQDVAILKYVKSELRTTMLQDRLNALILLSIHKASPLDYDVIVNSLLLSGQEECYFKVHLILIDPEEN